MRILVEPFGESWAVKLDNVENPQIYRHGSAAETAARALATRLAVSGHPVIADIKLRNGAFVGLLRFGGHS